MEKVLTIGIVGLGAMGLGISQVFAQAGFCVVGFDANAAARETASQRLAASLNTLAGKGKLSSVEVSDALGRFTQSSTYRDLAQADLIIEAIVEDLSAKQSLFHDLAPIVSPRTIFASNTSSLRIAEIARAVPGPDRVIGLHFFNPAPAMRLVELIGHPQSSPSVLHKASAIVKATGKVVVRAPDSPGFIVNRCARPFYGEAFALLEEGRTAKDIDAAMLARGYRLGPFALVDLIGADINLAATKGVYAGMNRHPRYLPFPALEMAVSAGDLGRKSGRGFIFPETVDAKDDAAISDRIETMIVNEAAWLQADSGIATTDIDTAVRLGLNFPKGPFEILQTLGKDKVRQSLAMLRHHARPELASRYEPAPFLFDPDR